MPKAPEARSRKISIGSEAGVGSEKKKEVKVK
jgi:hypothetical protein